MAEYVVIGKFMKGKSACPKCHTTHYAEGMQSPLSFSTTSSEEAEALNSINREKLAEILEYKGPYYILKVIGVIPQGESKAILYNKFYK